MAGGNFKMGRRTLAMAATATWLFPAVAMAADAADAGVALSEVLVTAKQRSVSTVSTKTDTPLIETPQAVSVITSDQISLRGALSLQDALGYSAGVRSDAYGNDGRVDSFRVRGDTPTQYLDGLRNGQVVYSTAKVDAYTLERIEVLKGPSSVLYGQGTVAGVVAMTTKRPQFTPAGEIVASYGTFDRKQIQGDYTAPLSDSVAFRVVGLYRKADSQVDHIGDDRWLIEPSLTWRPRDGSEITVLLRHQEDRTGSTTQFLPWAGTLLPNVNGKLSSSLFIGEPDWEKFNTNTTDLSLFGTHRFNEVLTYRANLRYSQAEVDYQTVYPNSYSNPLNPFVQPGQTGYVGPQRSITRYLSGSYPRTRTYALDNQLQAKFDAGPTQHTLLGGVDILTFKQNLTTAPARIISAIDLFNPVYGAYAKPTIVAGNTTKQEQVGVYLQDQIKIGALSLVGGLRHDDAKSRTVTPAGVVTRKSDSATTYRVGALYTLPNGLAPYVSYAQSFLPVTGTNLAGVPFDPQLGKQWEAGLKWQPKPGTLVTAAIYDLRDTNRVTTSPTNPLDRVQTGEVSVRGLELEGETIIAEHYEVTASYTYTESKISKSNNPLEVGKPLASTPKHLASLWGLRRFELGGGQLFRLGGGVRYSGESYDRSLTSPTYTITTPDHVLFDLMASYERDNWRFSVNVNNVADEYYFASCLARGDCFIGARRTVNASLAYRF